MMRNLFLTSVLYAITLVFAMPSAAGDAPPIKAGIIGLDAHALAWTKILNDPEAEGELADLVVVAGYPGGSPDIPQSLELLGKGVEPIRQTLAVRT